MKSRLLSLTILTGLVGAITLALTGCPAPGGGPGTGSDVTEKPWGTPLPIESNSAGDADFPRVACDGLGNAIVVWQWFDGGHNSIQANRYVKDGSWGAAGLIETDDAGEALTPDLACDPAGDAVAVWRLAVDQNFNFNIRANRFDKTSGWGAAGPIVADAVRQASVPQAACDGAGNALVVWHQMPAGASSYDAWAGRYDKVSGWSMAEPIENDSNGFALNPRAAFDGLGNAVVVWQRYDSSAKSFDIWANRYDKSAGWGVAGSVGAAAAVRVYNPRVVCDAAGNAIVVWRESDDNVLSYAIWANRYDKDSGWGTAGVIAVCTGKQSDPQVVVDAAGNAIAVWREPENGDFAIRAIRFVRDIGWGAAAPVAAHVGAAGDPRLAGDGAGNAIAVWTQTGGVYSAIRGASFSVGAGWGAAGLIGRGDAGDALHPATACDGAGNAVVVWSQSNGARSGIWANWVPLSAGH